MLCCRSKFRKRNLSSGIRCPCLPPTRASHDRLRYSASHAIVILHGRFCFLPRSFISPFMPSRPCSSFFRRASFPGLRRFLLVARAFARLWLVLRPRWLCSSGFFGSSCCGLASSCRVLRHRHSARSQQTIPAKPAPSNSCTKTLKPSVMKSHSSLT